MTGALGSSPKWLETCRKGGRTLKWLEKRGPPQECGSISATAKGHFPGSGQEALIQCNELAQSVSTPFSGSPAKVSTWWLLLA